MSFFNWIRFLLGDFQVPIQGQALNIIREADPDFPPTIGERFESIIGGVFSWIKIIFFGIVIIFILWLFIGRKK